jgi:hypothetical protein
MKFHNFKKRNNVMKETLCRMKSFLIFDSPLRNDYIRELFVKTHANYQKDSPHWSLSASRKKVIAEFWFGKVLIHFLVILTIGILVAAIPFGGNWHSLLMPLFLAGIISFIGTTAFSYWPMYFADFLPQLDTIIAEEQKAKEAEEEIKKCKRTQFSIPSLVIIYNVYTQAGNMSLLPVNDRSAELLNNIYGADKDKLKQNLSRLYKPSSQLSPKERAEFQKGIENARTVFEALNSQAALKILDQLELKLQRD